MKILVRVNHHGFQILIFTNYKAIKSYMRILSKEIYSYHTSPIHKIIKGQLQLIPLQRELISKVNSIGINKITLRQKINNSN